MSEFNTGFQCSVSEVESVGQWDLAQQYQQQWQFPMQVEGYSAMGGAAPPMTPWQQEEQPVSGAYQFLQDYTLQQNHQVQWNMYQPMPMPPSGMHQTLWNMPQYERPNITSSRPIAKSVNSRCNGISKPKRKRTAFTTDQVIALENFFSSQQNVRRSEREELSKLLNIDEQAIKVWFQNRRMKAKKDVQTSDEYDSSASPSTVQFDNTSVASPSSGLDYLEYLVQQPDKDGMVWLSDDGYEALASVISDILPATELQMANEVQQLPASCTPMYEPISPPDTSPESADDVDWVPPTDEESKRRLFDLHFC